MHSQSALSRQKKGGNEEWRRALTRPRRTSNRPTHLQQLISILDQVEPDPCPGDPKVGRRDQIAILGRAILGGRLGEVVLDLSHGDVVPVGSRSARRNGSKGSESGSQSKDALQEEANELRAESKRTAGRKAAGASAVMEDAVAIMDPTSRSLLTMIDAVRKLSKSNNQN
jgi:hypothetical protein